LHHPDDSVRSSVEIDIEQVCENLQLASPPRLFDHPSLETGDPSPRKEQEEKHGEDCKQARN